MTTTSTTGGDAWYDNISVYSSDYEPATFTPGPSVEANHDLLGGLRENDFDVEDSQYSAGLVTLIIVFLVAGLLACCLIPCLYKCLGTSRQERLRERMKFGKQTHYRGNILMVLASVAAIASAAGAIWGLERADSGLTNIEDATQNMATDMLTILNLADDTSVALDEVTASYEALQASVDDCDNGAILSSLLDAFDISSLTASVQAEIDDVSEDNFGELAGDVQAISDAVSDTEGARKGLVWPVLILSLMFTAFFVAISVSTYECVAFGHRDCAPASCCINPCTIFVAVVIWICAALAVSLSALTGDFCIDPDANANELITDNTDGEIADLITYYTGDCTSENVAVDAIIAAQVVAVPIIQSVVPTLYQLEAACSDLAEPVQTLDNSLESFWTILEDAGELSSCENLNGLYQAAVYDELCKDLPQGLLGFWVSCAFLTVLLLILAIQWGRMLRQQTTEQDASTAEAMNSQRAGWLVVSKRFSRRNVVANPPPPPHGASSHVQRPVALERPQHVTQR
ncbi:unnamed protein product [Ectocarpus sp. 12 AP-2014]